MDIDQFFSSQFYKAAKLSFHRANQQAETGVGFNKEAAERLLVFIDEEMRRIAEEVEPSLPPRPLNKGELNYWRFPAKPYNKDGNISSSMQKWCEKTGATVKKLNGAWFAFIDGQKWKVAGGETTITEGPMTLSNQDHLKDWLMSQGWEPSFWNFKRDKKGKPLRDERRQLITTSPKMTEAGKLCPNLEEMQGELVKPIIRWLSLKHRRSAIQSMKDEEKGWLNNERLSYDGRLSAGFAGLTNTYRLKHTTVVNVPKAQDDVILGKEMRALFRAQRPGYVLVGYDGTALENRVEAHYCYPFQGGKEYAEEILEGDVHKNNSFVFYGPELLAEGWYSPDQVDKEHPKLKPFRSRSKNGKYCVPMDTQCLVKDKGWCTYDRVAEGDLVLGYDPATKTKKWTVVTGKVFFTNTVVKEFRTKWFSFRATSDHRWFVKQRKFSLRSGKPSFSVSDSIEEVRTTEELTTESSIIVNAPMDLQEDLYQKTDYIADNKYETNWTLRVLGMSQQQRRAFLEGFMIVNVAHNGKSWSWSQNVGEISEAALTASYLVHNGAIQISKKTGNGATPMVTCKLSKKSHRGLQTARITELPPQDVWCLQTELGSWVMRQENVITITGNCLTYGGSPPKLARTLGLPEWRGEELYQAFWEANPALTQFRERVTLYWETKGKKKFIQGVDGRKVFTRSKHALVNTAFQSCGAIVMDYSGLFMDKWLGGITVDEDCSPCYYYQGDKIYRVGYWHDEYLWEVPEEHAEAIGRLGVKSIVKAGEFLKLRVPLDGEYKIGNTWADVH